MSYLKELPNACTQDFLYYAECDEIEHILQIFSKLMRGPSQLTHAERELMGTFVLALNNAHQPLNVHGRVLALLGGDQWKVQDLIKDPEHRCVDEKLRPLYAVVRKLVGNAHSVSKADIDACYDAGWDGRTIHGVVFIMSLFCTMARWTSALGMKYSAEEIIASSDGLAFNGYFGEGTGLEDDEYREKILPLHKPMQFSEQSTMNPRDPNTGEPTNT